MNCHICQSPSEPFGRAMIMGKHDVGYFRCPGCGFIQTETPYWLEEAYASSAITDSDTGLIQRNHICAVRTKSLIYACFDKNREFVDFGGGYGIFVRMMRDEQLAFFRYDRYCQNLFAQGFDVEKPDSPHYELLTAFEVFEHFADPLKDIESLLAFSPNLLFSTALVPASTPKPGEWWYYGLEHGQHISLFTRAALERVARHFGLKLYSDGHALHLLTVKDLPGPLFKLATDYRLGYYLGRFLRKPALPAVAR